VSRPVAGTIVSVDWRIGALPREPTKIRLAVVVEDDELFPGAYPNTVVVPLTRNPALAYEDFAERIDPATENGADETSWALAHHVTSVSLQRTMTTASRITAAQLRSLRRRIGLALGL